MTQCFLPDIARAAVASALILASARVTAQTEPTQQVTIIQEMAPVDEIVPDSLEIVETASGRTVVLMSSKPKEIVVVGSKIEP